MRCYDHKDRCEVAVKINRNTPFDHNNSRVEIGILKKQYGKAKINWETQTDNLGAKLKNKKPSK